MHRSSLSRIDGRDERFFVAYSDKPPECSEIYMYILGESECVVQPSSPESGYNRFLNFNTSKNIFAFSIFTRASLCNSETMIRS